MQINLAENYFQLFSMEATFEVQRNKLSANYQHLQKLFHPDRYATASAQEQRMAAQRAALINEAHRVLADDCTRAAYLLEMKGVMFNLETDTTKDSDFLMEQMALREAIETQSNQPDLLLTMQERLKQQVHELGQAFGRAYIKDNLEQARALLIKMQFIRKLQNETEIKLRRIEDDISDGHQASI